MKAVASGSWRDDEDVTRRPVGTGRAAEAAARTYLRKNLGWMTGFPSGAVSSGISWVVLPRPGGPDGGATVVVTRELLRRTEFCRNAAPRKFPRALPRVVGDVGEWSAHVETRLKWLKATVHSGAALPGLEELLDAARARRFIVSRTARLARRHRDLRRIAAALVWLHWGDEEGFQTALDAAEKHAASFEVVLERADGSEALTLVLRCIQLLADGSGAGLVELLGDRRSWDIPLSHGDLHMRLKKGLNALTDDDVDQALRALAEGPPRPAARMGPALADFALSLTTQSRTQRIRRLQLLQALSPEKGLEEWERWWTKYDGFERQAHATLKTARLWFDRLAVKRCRALGAEIKAELALPPLAFWRKVVSAGTGEAFAAASPKAFANLLDCLRLLSGSWGGYAMSDIFLCSWEGAFQAHERGWGVIENLLAAQRRMLEQAGPGDPRRQAWICESLTREAISIWIGGGKPQRLIGPVLETIGRLISNEASVSRGAGPFHDYSGWDGVLAVVEITGDPAVAAEIMEKAPPTAEGPCGLAWESLLRLSGGSVERFEALVKSWQPDDWTDPAIKELAVLAKEPHAGQVVGQSLLDGGGKQLSRIAARFALRKALAFAPEEEAQDRGAAGPGSEAAATLELAAYPAALHDLLADLARVDADAPRAVDKLLSQDYPLPSRMRAELGFLREEVQRREGERRKALAARMAKLEARLAAPTPEPGLRLGKYRAKLERRLRRFQVLQWETNLTEQIRSALKEKLGAEPPEEWLKSDEIMGVITALAGLQPGFRELAFRLLKARCGSQPWDLREEGPNRSFLADIERRGIRIEPWLNGVGPREVGGVAQPLWLDIEKDPLRIMRMGEPFGTCLSPKSFNFYSAVTNAADINKRVLFATDAGGVIRGRCLLALTDEGHLLTFRVYAHADQQAIEQAVAAYAQELAGAMGSRLAAEAEIRELVATRWYDDGSVDLTKQWAFLHPDSHFMKGLKTWPAGECIAELERNAGRDGVTPRMVCRLLDSEAFRERPELSVALHDYVGAPVDLPPYWRLTFGEHLRRAGATRAALAMIESLLSSNFRDDVHASARAASELIELGKPEQALRLLRQSRHPSVRDWPEDVGIRVHVVAKALEALGRPRQALELYRIAAKDERNTDAANRVAELEKLLAPVGFVFRD